MLQLFDNVFFGQSLFCEENQLFFHRYDLITHYQIVFLNSDYFLLVLLLFIKLLQKTNLQFFVFFLDLLQLLLYTFHLIRAFGSIN